MALAAAGLALSAVQLGVGLAQNANKEDPEKIQETAEMKAARARARQMAQTGFTPQEKAAFKQSLAASGNTAFRRAVDFGGGNLAAAIRAGINSQQLGAQNQFAAQDAALMRQNIANSNQLEQGYQSLTNQQVAQQNAIAAQQNQAAAQSINSGLTGMTNVLNLNQALKYNPSGVTPTTTQPVSQTQGIPTLTPSGQVAPVGLGNYSIGANSTVAPVYPNNQFYNNLYNDPYGLYYSGALGAQPIR